MKPELIFFNEIGNTKGKLIALEQYNNIPFEIKRVYYIYDTPEGKRRGFHAHKSLEQVAVCIKGACSFLLDNGKEKVNYRLSSPTNGLIIGTMLWHEMYDFTKDCILMVLASELYYESDYVRNYNQFLEMVS